MKKKHLDIFRSLSGVSRFLPSLILIFLFSQFAAAQTGKRPVIVIPGITGSQIVNQETGKTVWYTISFSRDEPDDLRLPISPNLRQNTDGLVAGDIIREIRLPGILRIFPDIGVYGDALASLKTGGYEEGDWENPVAEDVYYVFPYDWRRDNVESAQLLITRIEELKTRLKRPDLKFDLIAHSMGGLIARYAAMYGKADLPTGTRAPVPTWAGRNHINRILMFGTPNQGSFDAFEVLIKGYSVGGRRLPFTMNLSPEDVFSIPSLYQLMPNRATARFLDENLKPMQVDLYNPANWRKYGWGALSDPKFLGKLKDAEKIPGIKPVNWKIKNTDDQILSETTHAQAQRFLAVVLNRAQRFQQALNVNVSNSPIDILAYGSECAPTLNAVVLLRDPKKNVWLTMTRPDRISKARGRQVSKEDVSKAIYADGDGSVTRSSFLPEVRTTVRRATDSVARTIFPVKSTFFFCADHQKLLSNEAIRTNYLSALAEAEAGASKQN
jgi:pimeloyl-ACP methyl ester carboxylesterase